MSNLIFDGEPVQTFEGRSYVLAKFDAGETL